MCCPAAVYQVDVQHRANLNHFCGKEAAEQQQSAYRRLCCIAKTGSWQARKLNGSLRSCSLCNSVPTQHLSVCKFKVPVTAAPSSTWNAPTNVLPQGCTTHLETRLLLSEFADQHVGPGLEEGEPHVVAVDGGKPDAAEGEPVGAPVGHDMHHQKVESERCRKPAGITVVIIQYRATSDHIDVVVKREVGVQDDQACHQAAARTRPPYNLCT